MTSVDIKVPTRQSLAVEGRSAPLKVTGKLKAALHAMVWEGLKRDDAAEKAGLTVHGLREAFKRPHVKAEYLLQCEVLRSSGRARRIHRLEAMVEQDDNKAAVINAALALERLGESEEVTARRGSVLGSPGLVINIHNAPSSPAPVTIEHDPAE